MTALEYGRHPESAYLVLQFCASGSALGAHGQEWRWS